MKPSVEIRLPSGSEDIFIAQSVIHAAKRRIEEAQFDQVIVFADRQLKLVQPGLLSTVDAQLKPHKTIFLASDPHMKNMDHYQQLVNALMKEKASRKTCLVAVGGGGLGDLIGYLAATYMRGIAFIQIPTTLMSMADAIVGKVAIDYNGHKNLLGAFSSPRYVLCDPSVVDSLTDSQKAEGLVEIWKHSLIKANPTAGEQVVGLLENALKGEQYYDLIKFSLQTKKAMVEADPHDINSHHAALSLGHTLSNVLEKRFHISHGTGVLMGIIHASYIANSLELIGNDYFNDILAISRKLGQFLPQARATWPRINPNEIVQLLEFDKLNSKGITKLVLVSDNGYKIANLSRDQLYKGLSEAIDNYDATVSAIR